MDDPLWQPLKGGAKRKRTQLTSSDCNFLEKKRLKLISSLIFFYVFIITHTESKCPRFFKDFQKMCFFFQIMQDCFKLSFFDVTIKFTSTSFLHFISSNFPSMHLLILIRVVGALEPTPATIRRGVGYTLTDWQE